MGRTATRRNATRPQLRALGKLIDRNRYRGVTITAVADRAGVSIGYLSEVCRGLLPRGRKVPLDEYQRLRRIIGELSGVRP